MCSTTTPKPPTRSMTPRSDEPISMNTRASSRKIITVQNELPRMRMAAENTTCWYQPQIRPGHDRGDDARDVQRLGQQM